MKAQEKDLVHALARFAIAERFRQCGQGLPPIDRQLATFVGNPRTAVPFEIVRELERRGWLVSPAAGQRCVTDIGRQRIANAMRARGGL